jgi:hypothetical protein
VTRATLERVADKQVLYLTAIGRRTGLPREIEIWFVVCCERFYLFAETGEAGGWVAAQSSENLLLQFFTTRTGGQHCWPYQGAACWWRANQSLTSRSDSASSAGVMRNSAASRHGNASEAPFDWASSHHL